MKRLKNDVESMIEMKDLVIGLKIKEKENETIKLEHQSQIIKLQLENEEMKKELMVLKEKVDWLLNEKKEKVRE